MRIRNEPIVVRLPDGQPNAAPVQFIWRQRLWRVLGVQRSWVEASPWWDDPRVRRARGQDAVARWSAEFGGPRPAQPPPAPVDDDLLSERLVWRVEAAPGVDGVPGIYELACQGSDWRLRSVID